MRTDYVLFGGVALLIVIAVTALVRELPSGEPRHETRKRPAAPRESGAEEVELDRG